MIELDGSSGEGGGQILRTALTLSMITGESFVIANIRANRSKPGMMRQHLVAVEAAAAACHAEVHGAEVGSQRLAFAPGAIRGGEFSFAIGTAGSCTLVLQTLLPALLRAPQASTVRGTGGTHNSMAPPAQFLQRAYARVLAGMGAVVGIELKRYGFYPAGGGEIVASVTPCARLAQIELLARGELVAGYAESLVAAVPAGVARRELELVGRTMGWDASQLRTIDLPADQGPGNALLITLEHELVTEVFCGFGEKNIRADMVAQTALTEARRYVASGGALGEHLADQVMVPMALAGGGAFSTSLVSEHTRTNARVIEKFLPVAFAFRQQGDAHVCSVAAR